MIFQILIILFALFAIGRALRQYRRRLVSVHWFVLWTALWAVVIGVALAPKSADVIAKSVGVGRGADLALYLAVAVIFYLIFRLFVKTSDLEREITQLVRKIAVADAKEPDKKTE